MTPDQILAIREAFSALLARHVSQDELAHAIGLTPNNGGERVREFEDGKRETTGPVDRALGYLAQGLPQKSGVPEYVIGACAPTTPTAATFITRLRWPRFVARVDELSPAEINKISGTFNAINFHHVRGNEWLRVIQWIDDPLLFMMTPMEFMGHAAWHYRQWRERQR
jgi:hypothetical protein